MHISSTAEKLDKIIKACRRGKLATLEVGQMFRDEQLKKTREEHAQLLKATMVGKSSFSLDTAITEVARDASIFEIEAFDHWANLTSKPTRVHYVGAKFLVLNSTANCAKAVGNPTKLLDEKCDTPDYMDWQLKMWSESEEDPAEIANKRQPQILKSYPYNYIECFQREIEIEDKKTSCPTFTFRLKAEKKFKIGNYSYTPNLKKIHLLQGGPAPIEVALSRHLEKTSEQVDETRMLRELWHLKSELSKIRTKTLGATEIKDLLSPITMALVGMSILGLIGFIAIRKRGKPSAPADPGSDPRPTYVTINNREQTYSRPRPPLYPNINMPSMFDE